jgi:hypothetical protein
LAGLVTVLLIARFLPQAEQGYYYTFGSLIALQIVFELGFSFVILQMGSHERVHLTISSGDLISGNAVAHARLASVLQKTIRWYTTAAVLLAAFLIAAGSYFFTMHQHVGEDVFWRIPWIAAALFYGRLRVCAQRGAAQIRPGCDRQHARMAGPRGASWIVCSRDDHGRQCRCRLHLALSAAMPVAAVAAA